MNEMHEINPSPLCLCVAIVDKLSPSLKQGMDPSPLQPMRQQIPGKEWPASDGSKNACPCAAFPVGRILSLPIVVALAIHLFIGTRRHWRQKLKRRPDSPAGSRTEQGLGRFAYPVRTANRRFIDQTGKVYLLKTMSSWAMSQKLFRCRDYPGSGRSEALRFNAITVSPLVSI